MIRSEQHRFSVFQVNGIPFAVFFLGYGVVRAVVENDAVLQHFDYGSAFMVRRRFKHFYSRTSIYRNAAGKETSARSEAKLCRAERVFHCTVRR